MSDDGLGRNTAVMAAGTAVSRVLGQVRSTLLVAAVGLTGTVAADVFAVANWLPNIFFMLLAGGVLNAVLVPQVVRAYRSANGQEYVDRLLTLSFVILAAATIVLTLASPLIVRIIIGDNKQAALATAFAFWCLPQVFFYGVYTMLGQVLNARGSFGPYMWAPVVNNVIAIVGLVAFIATYGSFVAPAGGAPEDLGVWSGSRVALLAGVATLGVICQAAFLLLPLYRSGFRYRPRGDWRGAGLGTAGRVAGWTFAALAVGQVGVLIVMKVAAAASATKLPGIAGNAAYNIAFGIFMLPHSLVTVSLVTALFTRLSDHAAARDVASVRADFSHGLRTIAVFTLFAAPALAVLAVPMIRVLFPTTRAADAAAMAPIIVAFMTGLVAVGAWSLCQRVFYAFEDAKGLFRIQVIMAGVVAATAVVGWVVAPPQHWVAWSAAGIAASYVVGAVWGGAQVWRRLGGGLSRIIRLHVRAGLAAVVATGTGWLVSRVFGNIAAGGWFKAVAACVVVGSVMLGLYVLLLRRLGVTELDDLLSPLIDRLRRSMSTPGAARRVTGRGGRAAAPVAHGGGDRLDVVIGRGTLLAGRYRLHQPVVTDLPGVESWTARDQILDRPVRALVVRTGNVAAAQDAARRAALVTDRRLLRVLDVGDHEGVAYTVTEPVVGQDLAQIAARGPLDPDQARAIVGEAAAALEVARRRGVHHLALRPSAVHVTPDGSVLVSGLAMDAELLGRAGGDARATSRADTVGLVALLYLTLTGRWPDLPAVVPSPEGVTVAPATGGLPVPPAELAEAPNDLDTLCIVTLGPHDDGPHSPGELVRELEPWGGLDADIVYGAPDGASPPSTARSGPWDGEGPGRGGDPEPARPVQRQSIRQSFGDRPSSPGRVGTPPPARPPVVRRDAPAAPSGTAASGTTASGTAAAAAYARGGVSAVVGGVAPTPPASPAPASPVTPQPPTVPPPIVPAGRYDDFDDLISRSPAPGPRSSGRSPAPGPRSSVNATPIVLGIIGLLLVIGVYLAFKALTAPASPIGDEEGLELTEDDGLDNEADDVGAGEAPVAEDPATQTPTEGGSQAPSGTELVIASAQMLDPPPGGDNNEHPEAVPLAIDGDPATKWYSRMYNNPAFGMKPGIGYAVTLSQPATVSTVTLLVNGSGGNVEVRATDPSTPTSGEVLASGPLSPTTVLTLSQPTEATTIVLWFTNLPANPEGEYRIELFEVQLS